MASTGKKGKKSKEKKLSLQDFLMTTPSSGGTQQVAVQKVSSWAEECDIDDDGMGRTEYIDLPTAPRAARMQDDDSIPHTGPFSAKVSNLKYDLSEGDVDDFFVEREIRIKEMRLARDDQGDRLRGYGHIEFETRKDLLAALMLPDPIIHGRPFRIELAGENDQRDGRTVRKRYDNYVARDDKNESTNWRDRKEQSTFETVSDRGGDRRGGDRERGGYQNRSSFQNRHDNNNNDNGGGGNDDGGNWRLGERPANQSPPPERRRFNDRGGDRRDDRDGGDRRGGARDRYERRGGFEPEEERPVLNLAPRTKPLPVLTFPKEEEIERPPRKVSSLNGDAENHNDSGLPEDEENAPPPPKPKPTPVPSANIFGQAKPVDTAARERAIEEKLELEREAKIRAEKEAREQEREAAENAPEPEPKRDVIVIRTEKSRMQDEAVNWRKHEEPTSDSGSNDGGRNRDNGKRFIDGDRRRQDDRPRQFKDNRDRNFNNRDQGYRGGNMTRSGDNRRMDDRRGVNDRRDGPRRDTEIRREDQQPREPRRERNPKDPQELPQWNPSNGPNLSVSNAFAGLDDEDAD